MKILLRWNGEKLLDFTLSTGILSNKENKINFRVISIDGNSGLWSLLNIHDDPTKKPYLFMYKITLDNVYYLFNSNYETIDGYYISDIQKIKEEYNKGCLIDFNKKIISYRINRNASSQMRFQLGNNSVNWYPYDTYNYYTIDEISKFDNLNEYYKFFIYRDPIDRFLSMLNWVKCIKYRSLNYILNLSKENVLFMFVNILKIMYYFGYYNGIKCDNHKIPQYSFIEKFEKTGIDCVVKLEDLHDFILSKLNKIPIESDNNNQCIINESPKLYDKKDIEPYLDQINIYLKKDYDIIEKYKDKIWKNI